MKTRTHADQCQGAHFFNGVFALCAADALAPLRQLSDVARRAPLFDDNITTIIRLLKSSLPAGEPEDCYVAHILMPVV